MKAVVQFAKAFELWETNFSAEPTKFMSAEEIAASGVSEISASRASYLLELLGVITPAPTTDKEFLEWVHDRFVRHYGESKNMDYLHRLRGVIEKQR